MNKKRLLKPRDLKRKRIRARQRRDPASRLLDEVGRYLKANGGIGLVAGPIRIVDWPEDAVRNETQPLHMQFFALDVKVMGRRPVKKFGAGEKGAPSPTSDETKSPAPKDLQEGLG